ncbi:hypothetical protein [Acinetobacter lwoffii]|jgi:hypothetical protein|uniref:hypothetical protein n=1 Tax=Acinetobacter lwoffii TaxID=28090 RepID=UPI0021CD4305|nr:hypothetical protein [Acinetobacter lwoffii]MCU4615870.1 hypothetical protein [Acinetobacter lwoffii]
MIFDLTKVRTNTEKSRGSRSHFDFIDESALEEYAKVRVLLNNALEVFSVEGRTEIISRIKKNEEEKFHSVCFELLVAFIFKKIGCEVEDHPNIIDSEKHPDFLITFQNGESFYLELVTVQEYDDWSLEECKRFIRDLRDDKYYLNINSIDGRDLSHDEYKEFRENIKKWWNINKKIKNSKLVWKNSDGSFSIELEILETGELGLSSMFVWVNFHTQFLKSLKKKAKRYGDLEHPYIIATTFRPSSFSIGLQQMPELLERTLYGGASIFNPETEQYELIRNLWNTNTQTQTYNNISGVLFFDELNVYRVFEPFKYCLYLNDFSKWPAPSVLQSVFNFYYVKGNKSYQGSRLVLNSLFNSCI